MTASLIVETSSQEFVFRHALIRDAIYASLLATERQGLHLQVANRLEKLYPDQQENYVPDLAYHYYEAGAWEKVMEYGQMAGQSALNLAALREALTHLNRVMDAARHLS